MRLDHGGHLTHGSPGLDHLQDLALRLLRRDPAVERRGPTPARSSTSTRWPTWPRREQPQLIVAGSTAYARIIDPHPFREIADSVGALFMFDAAHPAGLIAGGAHPSPVGVADVVTFTTHKTLRGPRGGAIVCGADLAKKIDSAVFPGLQGGPLEHVIAAKAVAFAEAARPEFRAYAAPGGGQRRPLWPRPSPARASAWSREGPTTTWSWSTCGPSTPSSPARRPRRSSTGPASPATATPSPTTPARPS